MPLDTAQISRLWERSRAELRQRAADAAFLEGSIAEGFGNDRSDVDFVAIIDDGSSLPSMPYILFVDGRRIEVRLLSSAKLSAQLAEVSAALEQGPAAVGALSWELLDRCHRFLHCIPVENEALIVRLQQELGKEKLQRAVVGWFEEFARHTGRYAVAMLALGQLDYACQWVRTAVLHAAKCAVARRGETYIGLKWLSLQLDRAEIDRELVRRVWGFIHQPIGAVDPAEYVGAGVTLIGDLGVQGVTVSPAEVTVGPRPGVTTWQIGERVHVVRDDEVFALSQSASQVWRAIVWDRSCTAIANVRGDAEATRRRGAQLANFCRAGLIALRWRAEEDIRARHLATSTPVSTSPLISMYGARMPGEEQSDLQLLPMTARRFAEVGMEMTWANIGLENAREDALGALQRGQWRVLQFSLERMTQMASLVALSAFGVTPAPPLEEATLDAIRVLRLDEQLVRDIRNLERTPITSAEEAKRQFELAVAVTDGLRRFAGEPQFPASFDSASGWRGTVLLGFDWINMVANLDARFPMTGPGGRGSIEEARDVLAASGG